MDDLNQRKARDPESLCSELFQNKVIGVALKNSLLILLNEIKKQGEVPNFMNVTLVITIPKVGSKHMLINKRGMFKVSYVLCAKILNLAFS